MNKADRWYLFLCIVFFAPKGSMPHAGVHTKYGMFTKTDTSKMSYFRDRDDFEISDNMAKALWKNPPKVVE